MGYIFKADVYCEECGDAIRHDLSSAAPADPLDHYSYDSDDYPKEADVEHDESDCPEHCAKCGEFLHNPLTSHGYAYVQEALNDIPAGTSIAKLNDAGRPHLAEWGSYYGFTFWTLEDCKEDGRYSNAGWYSNEAF